MKAVILAAGVGSRLGMSIPKSLAVLVGEKTIFDYQVDKISKFVPTDGIFVVVGYKNEMLVERHPQLRYVYNEAYGETNTGKSLLKALDKIDDDDVLWLNGDVIFDEQVIPKLIMAQESCVLVDNKKCSAEEVKYNIDSEGYIKNISKEVFLGKGEALGINLVKRKQLARFRKHLALIGSQDYFEKAIENMINQDNIKFVPVNVYGLFCHEIDFPEDMEYVRKYLLKHDK